MAFHIAINVFSSIVWKIRSSIKSSFKMWAVMALPSKYFLDQNTKKIGSYFPKTSSLLQSGNPIHRGENEWISKHHRMYQVQRTVGTGKRSIHLWYDKFYQYRTNVQAASSSCGCPLRKFLPIKSNKWVWLYLLLSFSNWSRVHPSPSRFWWMAWRILTRSSRS